VKTEIEMGVMALQMREIELKLHSINRDHLDAKTAN
jgi:hypothetical protein